MSRELVLVERRGRVATVTLNRPDAMNALTVPLLASLADRLEEIASDDSMSVAVVTGSGRAFSAGVDLKALKESGQDISKGDVGTELNSIARWVQRLMETMPQATIAKVNGFCFTGALELVLACDIAVAADEAKFGDTHAMIGLRPTWGLTQRLGRRTGLQRARELSFTARTITGVEAAEYGLVLESTPRKNLDVRVAELADAIAGNSAGSVSAYKDLYRRSENDGLDDGLAYEARKTYAIGDVEERMAAILKRLGA